MSQEYSNDSITTNATVNRTPAPVTYVQTAPNGQHAFWKILLKDLLVTIVGVSLFGFFLTLVPILLLGACVGGCSAIGGSADVDIVETAIAGNEDAKSKVVVLPIEGEIESDTADGASFWTTALKDIKKDDDVKALVLRINSPGGSVSGSAYYHRLVKQLKEERNIPVVVSMGDLTASGGYYISMAADELVAEPSTWTGSIGVICPLYNAAELCQKIGVRSSAVTSGAMKGMGDFMKEPTEEETAIWKALVDDSYEQFLSVVRDGRPWYRADDIEDPEEKAKVAAERDEELRKVADGRIYSANQALERRLIDRIGYLDDTIDVALERAGLNKKTACVVVYSEPEGVLSSLGLNVKAKEEPMEKAARALSAASVPKAYYLSPNTLPL